MRRLVALACLLALAGCDRIPIDPVGTDLLVASPDLDVVFLDRDLRVTLVPNGPSGPLTLRIRGKEIDFDSTAGAFIYEKQLDRGLNVYPVSVTDEAGGTRVDTLYAVYLPAAREPLAGANDGVARAGATATEVGQGRTVVAGGVGSSGTALATASRLRRAGAQVVSDEVALLTARVGHTATPVAGGILLLGGATRLDATTPADFVSSAEFITNDGAGPSVQVVLGGDAPTRADHVARALTLDGVTYVYLLGGRVPTGSGATLSQTIDVYRVLTDPIRLDQLSPAGGASGFATILGPTLAPTGPATAAVFGLTGDDGASLALRWSTPGTGTFPFSLSVRTAAPLLAPRAGAATVDLGDGLALVVGGRGPSGAPVGTFEVYAAQADRVFRFPDAFQLQVPRSEHIATIFDGNRIVVSGGRPANGGPIVAYEAFQL